MQSTYTVLGYQGDVTIQIANVLHHELAETIEAMEDEGFTVVIHRE